MVLNCSTGPNLVLRDIYSGQIIQGRLAALVLPASGEKEVCQPSLAQQSLGVSWRLLHLLDTRFGKNRVLLLYAIIKWPEAGLFF